MRMCFDKYRICVLSLLFVVAISINSVLCAQISDKVYKTDYRIIPERKGELLVEIDNISFFKDDEYIGNFLKGYTLPGFWLQAKAIYYPLEN